MNKKLIAIVLIIMFFVIGLMLISNKVGQKPVAVVTNTPSLKNIPIRIGGDTFSLVNGRAEIEIAPGSATKNTLTLFGEPVMGDLDGDGDQDAAMLFVNNPGGSGSFYYAVLAINNDGAYRATGSMFLGDRIAPQTVEIRDGRVVYNFAERKAGESFAVQPSVGKSVWVNLDAKTNEIGELVQNFEGEADPNRMTLGMKKWVWIKTIMNDGKITMPNKLNVFTLTFGKDGKVSIGTDCNSMGATFTQTGKNLAFSEIYSTKMYCEGSQEQVFAGFVGQVGSYMFTSKGELILSLKMDSGSMTFK